jgi:putative SOS response-associated peptidase YedK
MCYSAIIQQHLKKLGLRFEARVQLDLFEELAKRRLDDDSAAAVKWSKELDESLIEAGGRGAALVLEYRQKKTSELEQELFKQKARLADAERSLAAKPTKGAEKEKGIATRQMERAKTRLDALKATQPQPDDARIFPFDYAPVIVQHGAERLIVPMRYHCRMEGKPAFYDRKFDGLYNARKDSLQKFWSPVFGHKHGLVVVRSFFENVKKHDYEKRSLRAGEKEQNIVLRFVPEGQDEMLIPCVWDHWTHEAGKAPQPRTALDSFAIITDDPPQEIAETGHNRCPIFLKPENVERWLTPEGRPASELLEILSDPVRPHYRHAVAA